MKTLLKLFGLVCLAGSSLNAANFLVLIQNNYNGKYLRAEQWGGHYLLTDHDNYGSPELAFIIEDVWAGTPWLEAGDPFWIKSEMNNLYWHAGNSYQDWHVQVYEPAPSIYGTEAFKLVSRLAYGGTSQIKPNDIIWPNNSLYANTIGNYEVTNQGPGLIPGYDVVAHRTFKFTILAVTP